MPTITLMRHPYTGTVDRHKVARLVFNSTNLVRRRYGLTACDWHPLLADLALRHTSDMIDRRFVDHVNPDGLGPGERLLLHHPGLVAMIGENLARVPLGPEENLADELTARWMASAGHRNNILRPGFTHLGLCIQSQSPYLFATQVFGEVIAQILSPRLPFQVDVTGVTEIRMKVATHFHEPQVWTKAPSARAYPLACSTSAGETRASFVARAGAGTYQLMVGPRGADRLTCTGVTLVAR